MPEPQSSVEFQFVNSTIYAPTKTREQAVRALIRKQAMKKTSAARRKDGNYGKHNLRQYPIFIVGQESGDGQPAVVVLKEESPETDKENNVYKQETWKEPKMRHKATRGKGDHRTTDQQIWFPKYALSTGLCSSLPAKGYELTSMKSDFDILELSTLASMFASRAVRAELSKDPHHLIHQVRTQKQWSYLSYLPSLYTSYPCLSAATDCVIARARQIMSPHQNWGSAVTSFYCKALGLLQRALDDPEMRYRPEVLCATEILALFELLDPAGETAWIRHSAGAARLIQVRGPQCYTTEFEKALFMAHTGPIMTECVMHNTRCFLEEDSWQDVFRSIIVDEDFLISDRSEITINLIMIKAYIPGLFRDVTAITCVDPAPSSKFINKVASSLRRSRADLLAWHDQYTKILSYYPYMRPGSFEYDAHCKVFSTYATCLMISSRLLGAISNTERADCEDCTQQLADDMFELCRATEIASHQTRLFMSQTTGIAGSVQATQLRWREFTESQLDLNTPAGAAMSRATFENWCNVTGRKMPGSSQ